MRRKDSLHSIQNGSKWQNEWSPATKTGANKALECNLNLAQGK